MHYPLDCSSKPTVFQANLESPCSDSPRRICRRLWILANWGGVQRLHGLNASRLHTVVHRFPGILGGHPMPNWPPGLASCKSFSSFDQTDNKPRKKPKTALVFAGAQAQNLPDRWFGADTFFLSNDLRGCIRCPFESSD